MREPEQRLQQAADREREALLREGQEHARPGAEEEAKSRLTAYLDQETAPPAGHRPRRLRPILIPLAAAAALLAIVLTQISPTDPDPRLPRMVGSEPEAGELWPDGAVSTWPTFTWTFEQPEGGWYTLRVMDEEGATVLEREDLEDPYWEPDEDLPDWIEWTVTVVGSRQEIVDRGRAEAWLEP